MNVTELEAQNYHLPEIKECKNQLFFKNFVQIMLF